MFEKILIANRGEIAVRIMQTAKKMGIRTVAVYSEADTNALHVREADEAVYIGPAPSAESYLNIAAIISAARKTGAEAVHPGYGFLSENQEFAKALKKAGIVLIGPSAEVIRLMGDKIESKKVADKAGVSTVPGSPRAITNADEAARIAKKIGFPVMVKAAAGGGGKGMRVAHNEQEVRDGFVTATNEAQASFRDNRVFIEKFIESPRHIEIQILADTHGNILWLGERECSIQRRNQKIIEEAPSPFLDEKTRQKMGRQAVALAKKVGYSSAGTVEFIADEEKNFYFLEMNTRLQVEHRVTELITGIDLVEQMIRIANEEKLELRQSDIRYQGWAIEARVYAEDPTRGFLPSTGRISRHKEPEPSSTVIVDTGVFEGGEVSMFYDPMIAKVCSYGRTRDEAVTILRDALSTYTIRGISHNISFLEAILAHPRFNQGELSTNFIQEEYGNGYTGAELTTETAEVLLAVGTHIQMMELARAEKINGQLRGHNLSLSTRWVVSLDESSYSVSVEPIPGEGFNVMYDGGAATVHSQYELGRRLFQGTVNGRRVTVKVLRAPEGLLLTYAGSTVRVIMRTPRIAELARYLPRRDAQSVSPNLLAPINGRVVAVKVKEGDPVYPNTPLLVIEAMKMENLIHAEHPARVTAVHVAEGDNVTVNQKLLDFGPADDSD